MNKVWGNESLTLRAKRDGKEPEMRAFAKLWGPTERMAESLGWNVNPGAIIELYMERNARSVATQVFVSPYKPERFLFRVTPTRGAGRAVFEALQAATLRLPYAANVALTDAEGREVVEVRTSRALVLGLDAISEETAERRLLDFVEPLLRSIPLR